MPATSRSAAAVAIDLVSVSPGARYPRRRNASCTSAGILRLIVVMGRRHPRAWSSSVNDNSTSNACRGLLHDARWSPAFGCHRSRTVPAGRLTCHFAGRSASCSGRTERQRKVLRMLYRPGGDNPHSGAVRPASCATATMLRILSSPASRTHAWTYTLRGAGESFASRGPPVLVRAVTLRREGDALRRRHTSSLLSG
jgi:hypothetical protein